jgi:predicted ABC-type ATPase
LFSYIIEFIGFSGRSAAERGKASLKDIIIIGGPNGAGKTSAAQELVPRELNIREFVNADEIARGLSPFNPEGVAIAAGRLMIERMKALVGSGESFAFEMTCAGRAYAPWLRECQASGWRVLFLFLWLPTPQVAIERVARRVREGGHAIPNDVVIRRWKTGLVNMRNLYLPLSDGAQIHDNSDGIRILIAERTPDAPLVVHDAARWAMIEKALQ